MVITNRIDGRRPAQPSAEGPARDDVLIVVAGGNVTAVYAPRGARVFKLDWDNIKDEPLPYHLECFDGDGPASSRAARKDLEEARHYIELNREVADGH